MNLKCFLERDMRCAPDPIRNHLTLTVTPSTTYETAKEAILSYERSSKTWDVSKVLESVKDRSGPAASGSSQGPTPMEIDAVQQQHKGKGKDYKGKGKGNYKGGGKNWWSNIPSWFGGKSGGKSRKENTKGNPKARAKAKQRVSMDRRLAKVKDSRNKGAESVVSLDIGGMSAPNVCEK